MTNFMNPDERESAMAKKWAEAEDKLAAANERIKMLIDAEALMRRNAQEWKDAYTAERTVLERERLVSDKLEKALKVAKAFCDGLTAEECPDTVALPISATLVEVARIREQT